VLEFANLELKH